MKITFRQRLQHLKRSYVVAVTVDSEGLFVQISENGKDWNISEPIEGEGEISEERIFEIARSILINGN